MPKSPLIYRIVSPVILAVFTFVSCNVFNMPGEPPLSGDVRFVFLDEYFNRVDEDQGILALVIENNSQADGVWIIADLPYNHRDNDMVVHVISEQDDLFVSVFFDTLRDFPRKMVITMEEEEIIGEFSELCQTTMTFSIDLRDEYEQDTIRNIVLDRSNIPPHLCSPEFTQLENLRLRHIMTTLAIWESMADQIDGDEPEARFWRRLRRALVTVLTLVAVAVVIVVVIAFPPAAPVLSAVIDLLIPNRDGGNHARPEPNPDRRPKAEITTGGNEVENVENNEYPPRSLALGESAIFYIAITQLGEFSLECVVDMGDALLRFNPGTGLIPDIGNPFNAQFFNTSLESVTERPNTFRLTVTRNNDLGFIGDGRIQFVIRFQTWMIINENGEGGYLLCGCGSYIESVTDEDVYYQGGHLFIFNFTSHLPQDGNGYGDAGG